MLRRAAFFTRCALAFYSLVTSERCFEVPHGKWAALSLLCPPLVRPGGEVAEAHGPLFGGGALTGQWVAQ